MADGSQAFTPWKSVVGFAGGGGSSVAVKLALGVDPDVAMNHWLTAVLAHQRHFPGTEHHCADIFDADPTTILPGERIAFGWFSPDCTDFSKAKGKAPRSERIRGLAWSVIPWALTRRIEVIMLENVEEFAQWGPVYREGLKKGEPIPARRAETFNRWKSRLEKLGYVVDWRVLNAADYGAPTTRKRLYLVARCDGRPITWPERTHAPRKDAERLGLKPWVGAREIIDWSLDCPSIFLDPAEVADLRKRTGKRVNRPLVPATLKRVARGMDRYVIGAAEPFLVNITQRNWAADRAHAVREGLPTLTSSKGGEYALVDPTVANVVKFQENSTFTDPREPLHTVMAGAPRHGLATAHLASVAHGAEARAWQTGHHDKALVAAHLASLAHGEHGERPGSRTRSPDEPAGHISAGGGDQALVAGSLVRTNFTSAADRNGVRDPADPMATSTSEGGIAVTSACLVPRNGERAGQAPRAIDIAEPVPTPVPTGNQGSMAAATLVRQFGTGGPRDIEEPTATNTAGGERGGEHTQVVTAYMAQGNEDRIGRGAAEPTTAQTGRGTQQQLVAASLDAYYSSGSVGADAGDPMRTSTGKDRLSLIAAWLEQANTGMVGHPATAPVSTIVAGGGEGSGWGAATQRLVEARLVEDGGPVGRRGKVLEFLWAHFGLPTAEEWAAPVATLDARRKFGLVILPDASVWMIVDIGLRMLTPAELAAAMGLPAGYDLSVDCYGRPVSKTHQTQMIGNMVSPPPAAALIAANCGHLIQPPSTEDERRPAA